MAETLDRARHIILVLRDDVNKLFLTQSRVECAAPILFVISARSPICVGVSPMITHYQCCQLVVMAIWCLEHQRIIVTHSFTRQVSYIKWQKWQK